MKKKLTFLIILILIFVSFGVNAYCRTKMYNDDYAGIYVILGLIGLLIYIIPSFIYKGRNKLAFVLINIFLGWTGLVWVALLIISFLAKKEE